MQDRSGDGHVSLDLFLLMRMCILLYVALFKRRLLNGQFGESAKGLDQLTAAKALAETNFRRQMLAYLLDLAIVEAEEERKL
ncbi:hypothetical protein CPT32_24200 [Rhizobium sophoriradicis]|uniref:hypothetical protein n=1 Tax=Rhizobium sophoriradicis TaxID=1535245 RepID=UPI000BBDE9D9|nr:hypothetical protein [Rhizobium sophoriradicis]PCK84355.1 hypothetical protein CPT32_24200 [Rhizobium sophoriradicis]